MALSDALTRPELVAATDVELELDDTILPVLV